MKFRKRQTMPDDISKTLCAQREANQNRRKLCGIMTVRRFATAKIIFLTLFTIDNLEPPYEPLLAALARRARETMPKLDTKPKAPAPVWSYRIISTVPEIEEKLVSEEVL